MTSYPFKPSSSFPKDCCHISLSGMIAFPRCFLGKALEYLESVSSPYRHSCISMRCEIELEVKSVLTEQAPTQIHDSLFPHTPVCNFCC